MAIPSMPLIGARLTRKECTVHCLSSVLAPRLQTGLEVGNRLHRRQRQFLLFRAIHNAGELEP